MKTKKLSTNLDFSQTDEAVEVAMWRDPAVFQRQQTENDIDDLLLRAEQAFKLRQYLNNNDHRESLGDYGRDLVKQAVEKLGELNATK